MNRIPALRLREDKLRGNDKGGRGIVGCSYTMKTQILRFIHGFNSSDNNPLIPLELQLPILESLYGL
jgi:hypothetical protein